jgi:hypothetical protein
MMFPKPGKVKKPAVRVLKDGWTRDLPFDHERRPRCLHGAAAGNVGSARTSGAVLKGWFLIALERCDWKMRHLSTRPAEVMVADTATTELL